MSERMLGLTEDITQIAQRLDEMTEDTPELGAYSEDLGKIVEALEGYIREQMAGDKQVPAWLLKIQNIVEGQAFHEMYRDRAGGDPYGYEPFRYRNSQVDALKFYADATINPTNMFKINGV